MITKMVCYLENEMDFLTGLNLDFLLVRSLEEMMVTEMVRYLGNKMDFLKAAC